MIRFSALLQRLNDAPKPAHRQRVLAAYRAAAAADDWADDGAVDWAEALLAGTLRPPTIPPATLRALIAERTDPTHWRLSMAFVGDQAETLAYLWPARATNNAPPSIAEILATPEIAAALPGWLDACDPLVRHTLLRLLTGKIRPRPDWFTAAPTSPATAEITAMLLTARGVQGGLVQEYSFGVRHDGALVPVAQISDGIADDARLTLEAWVRTNTVARFGPVREVALGMAVRLAFTTVELAPRRKAGLLLRDACVLGVNAGCNDVGLLSQLTASTV